MVIGISMSIEQELTKLSNPERAALISNYFKSEKPGYPLKDKFLGLTVPQVREVARKYKNSSLQEVSALLVSPYHELRLCGLIILTLQFPKADEAQQAEIYNFYLNHTSGINNWDLVDVSAKIIVGGYLFLRDRSGLDRLAESTNLWEQRISVIATMYFIGKNDLDDTFRICEKLLFHPHHYIQKAVGWVLREAGKKDVARLESFLEKYAATMPRITLRYSLEKFSAERKLYFMKKAKLD
ncbi:MAG: DNA alkylation repair protein [Patescibacteria group bacterium]